MMKKKLILASQSLDRRQMLEQLGIDFEVMPSDYEEDKSLEVSPEEMVTIFSQGKARDVAQKVSNAIVIGADTVGYHDGQILHKPKDHEDARRTIKKLAGKTHRMMTGFTIIDSDTDKEITEVAITDVTFRKLSDEEIAAYVESEEIILRVSGSYAVRHKGYFLVKKHSGDTTNIAGLPIAKVIERLKKDFDYQILPKANK